MRVEFVILLCEIVLLAKYGICSSDMPDTQYVPNRCNHVPPQTMAKVVAGGVSERILVQTVTYVTETRKI
jgi:hypothetical protein